MSDTKENLPHWDLSNIFPGLDSPEYDLAYQDAIKLIDDLEAYLARNKIDRDNAQAINDLSALSRITSELINQLNLGFKQVHTLNNYVHCFITTDSYSTLAMRQHSKIQAKLVRLE